MQPSIVDVDEPDTWPAHVRSRAEELALDHLAATRDVSDLSIPIEGEDDFRKLFEGRRLLTYHATRLLPHEVEWMRSVGLLLATEELVMSRLSRALEAQLIDQSLHDSLIMGNVFADRDADNREGQICLVLSRKPFDSRPRGFHYLLSEWGGELITMSKGGANVRSLLQQLGTPSIVVAEINLGADSHEHSVYPSLQHTFVGRILEIEDLGASVHYRDPIPPEHIVDIWQPGHPEYDRHVQLARD